jgi:integrase-like protein
VKKADLVDFHFHDLRHTAASYMVMRGASLADVKEILGHADLKMTMRYAHLSPAHLRTAVDRLDGLTSGAAAPQVAIERAPPVELLLVHPAVTVERLGALGWISLTDCGTTVRDTDGSIPQRQSAVSRGSAPHQPARSDARAGYPICTGRPARDPPSSTPSTRESARTFFGMSFASGLPQVVSSEPQAQERHAMAAITTAASLGRRRSYSLAVRIGVALLLASGLVGLDGSPASALAPKGGLGGGGIIIVPPDPPPPPDSCQPQPTILYFTATPLNIDAGTSTTLRWSVRVPDGCAYALVVSAGPPNWISWTSSTGIAAQPQGAMKVQPAFDTSYQLTLAWGPNLLGTASKTTPVVTVNLPIAPIRRCTSKGGCFDDIPDCSLGKCRHTVTIDAPNLAPLLVQALGTPSTTVIVKDGVELDLSPQTGGPITIANGVQLIGERIAEPGKRFQPGPRLFVTTLVYHETLFETQGDTVRVTGVQIQGPSMTAGDDDHHISVGIQITGVCGPKNGDGSWPHCPSIPGHVNVEIDHNEFSGWSNAALQVSDEHGQIVVNQQVRVDRGVTPAELVYPTTEPVWIHDNFFHHNLHNGTAGYGVNVGGGAHALIERNVFDNNRHAITSGNNDPRVGYRAYLNLVLSGHGTGEQMFDIHGSGESCIDWPLCLAKHHFWVGRAGNDFDIRYNSFLYKDGAAVLLRGTPTLGLPEGAIVRFNVFAHDLPFDVAVGTYWFSGAVKWTEAPGPTVQDNLTDRKSYPPSTILCDFDGDGVPDTFIATEQTLWYCPGPSDCVTAPGSGKPTWVYLNMSTKRVDQLALGHFSGGPVCDVVDGDFISVGGAGTWKPLDRLPVPR